MKIYLCCPQCLNEQSSHESSQESPDPIKTRLRLASYPIDLTNETSYVVNCKAGHSSVTAISLTNYEILFEIGVFAVLDGYYREAVTSFAASLERYFEFSTRAITLAHGCSLEDEDNCWKEISSQSERQLGAYIYLSAIHFKEKPQMLSKKMIELRNSAVHKGMIPSLDKVALFGEEALSIIRDGSDRLLKSIPDAAHKVASGQSKISFEKAIATGAIQSGCIQQISSAIRERCTLEKHLKIMRRSHSENSLNQHSKILNELSQL